MAFENLRNRIRVSLHARRGNTFGKGVSLMPGAFLSGNTVGEHVRIGADCRCFGVDIGDYVSLGPRVIIGEFEHPTALPVLSVAAYTEDENEEYRSINRVRTVLGEDCWLGANVFVRKGCRIGKGAIVGAGAIVLKDVEPFAVVAGAPARLIRYRDSRTLPSERLK